MITLKGLVQTLRALAVFAGTLAAFVTFWLSPASRPVREALEALLAQTAGGLLSLFIHPVTVSGSTVVVRGFAAEVIPACTGLFTISILTAAVLAYPCAGRAKLLGIALIALGVLTLNWVRIVTLLLAGAYWPQAFELLHLVIWRSVAVLAALGLWLLWARRIAPAFAR